MYVQSYIVSDDMTAIYTHPVGAFVFAAIEGPLRSALARSEELYLQASGDEMSSSVLTEGLLLGGNIAIMFIVYGEFLACSLTSKSAVNAHAGRQCLAFAK